MSGDFPSDLYTEPAEVDPGTLRNLGPLVARVDEARLFGHAHPHH